MRCTIKDIERVERVLKNDLVWDACVEDGTPDKKDVDIAPLLEDEKLYFLMPNEGTVVVLYPMSAILYSIHFNTLKQWRGQRAVESAKEVFKYISEHTPCKKLMVMVPNIYPGVIRFYLKVGFNIEGYSKESFLKNDTLVDQIIFGKRG